MRARHAARAVGLCAPCIVERAVCLRLSRTPAHAHRSQLSPRLPYRSLGELRHRLSSSAFMGSDYFALEWQRSAVDTLQAHIAQVRDGSEDRRCELSVLRSQATTSTQIEQRLAAYLDMCYWQLAQFRRYSNPYRIAEAETCLREVLCYAHTPELYLAVAIHKVLEKELEDLSRFSSAFEHLDTDDAPALGPRSELWARASWARLLKRLDPVTELEALEQLIFISGHPDEPAVIKKAHQPQIVSATAVLPKDCRSLSPLEREVSR
ncbi:hypothetical protein C8Q76DRAFT_251691 [Earliella scabrosa]|nr:hypothetical protein C8Q76DRAFT_251691 [Earliella scabrosa]